MAQMAARILAGLPHLQRLQNSGQTPAGNTAAPAAKDPDIMSSIGTAAAPASAPAQKPADQSLGSIIHNIWTKIGTDFSTAEQWIETNVARVEAVLPGAAPVVQELKQSASDAIGVVAAGEATFEPVLVAGVEGLLDTAIATYAGPYAIPLSKLSNDGLLKITGTVQAQLQAWLLKQQAAMAENTAKAGG
jgi:hypothetical protein